MKRETALFEKLNVFASAMGNSYKICQSQKQSAAIFAFCIIEFHKKYDRLGVVSTCIDFWANNMEFGKTVLFTHKK